MTTSTTTTTTTTATKSTVGTQSGAASSATMATYGHPTLTFARGVGCHLFEADGTSWLDLAAGIAVCTLGHAPPRLVAALTQQASQLWHTSNLYRVAEQERLAERLVAHSFADVAFLANSGTEAVEAAIKTARRFHHAHGQPERIGIVALPHAFHGRTLGALSAAGNETHLTGCGPRADGFVTADAATVDAVRAAIDATTAAVIVEPVQGEGGIRPIPAEVLRGLRTLCDEHGILLIFDEVQCGMARTGRLFAHEHVGVTPDVMALAKGMGGGFPIGACLATERAAAGMTKGAHGSTFGGNPLACAVANAVLDAVLEPGFLESVAVRGTRWQAALDAVRETVPSVVGDVRGVGLMLGLVTEGPAAKLQEALLREHVLTVTAGPDVVRLLPPLTITDAEIDHATDAIARAARAVHEATAGESSSGA